MDPPFGRRMTLPEPAPSTNFRARIVAPWSLFALCLAAALLSFFLYAHRVPSLLHALGDS